MGKAATVSDVLCALEYGKEQLCRWPTTGSAKSPAWSLEPSGIKVPPHIADRSRESGNIVLTADSKYGEQRFAWLAGAA